MQDQPNNLQKRHRCPKGTKMSKAIKTLGALRSGDKADRRAYMRAMATVEHEAAHKIKMASRMSNDKNTRNQMAAVVPRTTHGDASVAAEE